MKVKHLKTKVVIETSREDYNDLVDNRDNSGFLVAERVAHRWISTLFSFLL